MTYFLRSSCALVALAGAVQAAPMDYVDQYTSYVAFGDSLTQDNKGFVLAPPSFEGRFTNGLGYSDLIAGDFADQGKFTANFALGGATAEDDNESHYPDPAAAAPLATFDAQVSSFAFAEAFAPIGDNPLISVLFGANDIFQDIGEGPLGSIGVAAADAVMQGIETLAALGDRYDDFVVMNMPDLGRTPALLGTLAEEAIRIESLAFNLQLAANMEVLRGNGLNIVEVDLMRELNEILADPGALGLTNTTEACTETLQVLSFDNCAFDGLGFDRDLADAYLWTDRVHPNQVVHAAFADELRVALAPVPLPAALPLMVLGLGALGAARRARKG